MENITTIQIDWSDLDAYAHVNNTVYFRMAQSARIHLSEKLGVSATDTHSFGFILAESNCKFIRQVRYPDTIKIVTKVSWIKNSSFQLEHEMYNDQQELVAKNYDILVMFDYQQNSKMKISDELRSKILNFSE